MAFPQGSCLTALAGVCLMASSISAAPPANTAKVDDQRPVFRVGVDVVMVNFTVHDKVGRYVKGLAPKEVRILENGVPQQIDTFAEGATVVQSRSDARAVGGSVFILFDTSDHMYSTFVHAVDAIADFIRGLDERDAVAVYSFSRNLTRTAPLTSDHREAIAQLRSTCAGGGTALYNSLLLTVRDAAKVPGRKIIVVFSNGADDSSVLSPDDVRRAAEDEGIPIYVVSTKQDNPISRAAFGRLTSGTGGEALYASSWERQVEAFSAIRDDIKSFYTVTYRPRGNSGEGFRTISVEVTSDPGRTYRIRGRSGYRPKMRNEVSADGR